MDERDPIKQLQQWLDDPGKLLEKISSIRTTLGSIRSSESATPQEVATPILPAGETRAVPEAPKRRYSRALQTIREMQTHLEDRVLPLARAAARAEVEHLRERAGRDQVAMSECLARIDRRMLDCIDRIHESEEKFAALTALNQHIVELGSAAEPLPRFTPQPDPSDVIKARLIALRQENKI